MSLDRDLWWDWGYGFLGERAQRRGAILTSYQGYLRHQHDISLLMLILSTRMRQCSSGFSTEKLLSFPLTILHSLEGKSLCTALLRSGELCSVSLKVKCLQKLFGIHLHRQAVSSPHLFIQSFIYTNRLTGIYFILWVIIQFYFIYFVLKWFQLWPLGALLFDSWVPLPCPIIMFWFFFWTTSLLCRTTGCSSHFACCLPQA